MKFGFIGTGNMGGTLAKKVIESGYAAETGLSNRTMEKAVATAGNSGAKVSTNAEIAGNAKYIFLGVKPQMMEECLGGIAEILAKRQDRFVLITMAAGIKTDKIRQLAGANYPVVRIMPNTPAAVGEGVILMCATDDVGKEEKDEICEALSGAGMVDELPENLMDAATAVSGCGPAYVYLCIEALADGAVECGIPRQKALAYAAKTLLGSAKMVLETGKHPGQLKDEVCSPGGSTIAGVHALENNGFRNALMDAVNGAYKRTKELG